MNTGAAVQDFSELSKINYSKLPETERLGRERLYQAEQVRGDRVRADAQLPALKELQANNLLKAGTEGVISGILQSNPQLMQTLDSGTDSEQVNKAYKKFVQGNSGLADNSILSQFVTQADKGMKEAQALQFEQDQAAMTKKTSAMNAAKSLQDSLNEGNQSKKLVLRDMASVQQFMETSGDDYPITPVTLPDGTQGFEVGTSRAKASAADESMWLSNAEIKKLQDTTGLNYKQTPFMKNGVMGAYIQESFAPTEEIDKLNKAELSTMTDIMDRAYQWTDGDADSITSPRFQAESNLAIYREVLNELEGGTVVTGTTGAKMIAVLGQIGLDDPIRSWFKPNEQDALDRVRGVVFQGLRLTLGPQFTENEGKRLVAATYNDALSPEQNARRLERLAKLLEDTIAYKDYTSELGRTTEGALKQIKGEVYPMKSWFQNQIKIMEDDFDQESKIMGTGGDSKPMDLVEVQYRPTVQAIINKHEKASQL